MTTTARPDDFSDFGEVTYLNCAAQGPLPRVAAAAVEEALDLKRRPHLLRDEDYFEFPDAYRDAVANLIGARSLDIAVTDSTTHGIMLLVHGLDWREGDEVVIARGEFPANYFPWRSLETRGVRVKQIEVPWGESGPADLDSAIGDRTRVVSLAWVRYSTGLRIDVGALGEVCRNRGVTFVIDGSQGVGGLDFDLRESPCDLLACSGYKWLLGPFGLGFAYVAPALAERLALRNINWFSISGARDFNNLSRCELRFEPGARRFDINETGNFFNLSAGTASLRYLAGVTIDVVERHARALQDRIVQRLPQGFRVLGPNEDRHRSSIFCIAGGDDGKTAEIYRRLRKNGVIVSHRENTIRISPHIYNTERDADRLLEGLDESSNRSVVAMRARSLPVGAPLRADPPAAAPSREPLVGDSITLVPLDADATAKSLFAASHGSATREALWTYMAYGPFEDSPSMRQWLGECSLPDDPLFFAVVHRETELAIGMAAYQRIDPASRSIEVAHIWYAPEYQRTRTNTETVYILLREAFDRLGYRRVEWKCDSLNRRSRTAALRLGFHFEGVFRQHLIVKGRNRDTAWYAMLDGDWPEVRKRLEGWLSR